jgi:hypothetical protein
MSYFSEIAWGTLTKNVIPYYSVGVFQLNTYTIEVYPIDINEPGASSLSCDVNDYFIDFLGYPWRVLAITSISSGLRLRVYDINERSASQYVNYGPYPNKIGYVYKPTKNGIILSQAQLLKLDSQARDRINNFEKGVLWESRGVSVYDNSDTYNQITRLQLGNNLSLASSSEDSWYGGLAKIIGVSVSGTDDGFLIKGSSGEIVNSEYQFSTDTTLSTASDTQISSTLAIKTYVDNMSSGGNFLDAVIEMQVDNTTDPTASPTSGDRYILLDTSNLNSNFGTISGVGDNDIVEFNGSSFAVIFDSSAASMPATVTVGLDSNGNANHQWTYNTIDDEWIDRGAVVDHNDTGGKQGGTTGEYYHLSQTHYNDLTDSGDATIHYHSSDRNRSNHTGTQLSSTISDFSESIDDRVSSLIQNDANSYLTWSYSDASNTLTPSINASSINYWSKSGSNVYYNLGNIGLGTNTPTYKIDIQSNGAGSNLNLLKLQADNLATGSSFSQLFIEASAGLMSIKSGIDDNILLSANNNNSVYLKYNGDVGIGNTTPSYKLDVSGTGRFTSSVIGVTESTSDSSTKFATTAFVKNQSYIKLTNLSSTATGLTYTNTTGVFSLTSGYSIPATASQSNWNTAYGWGNHASVGYLTSNQTITLSGDVSGSGTTSITCTVANNSHNHTWSNITSTPATISGYGITDAYTKTESNANYTSKTSYGLNNFYGDYLIFGYDLFDNDYISFNKTNNKYYLNSGAASMQNTTANAGLVANAFIKQGGTSSQFLKANGDVDSTTYTSNTGTVTSVTAGNGLTLTGTSTINPTLSIVSHPGSASSIGSMYISASALGVNLGTTSTTAAAGNHTHDPNDVINSFDSLTAFSGIFTWAATNENVNIATTSTNKTINITSPSNGMSGMAYLSSTGSSIVIQLNGSTSYVRVDSNANLTLESGSQYMLTWVYQGTYLLINIAEYVSQ